MTAIQNLSINEHKDSFKFLIIGNNVSLLLKLKTIFL